MVPVQLYDCQCYISPGMRHTSSVIREGFIPSHEIGFNIAADASINLFRAKTPRISPATTKNMCIIKTQDQEKKNRNRERNMHNLLRKPRYVNLLDIGTDAIDADEDADENEGEVEDAVGLAQGLTLGLTLGLADGEDADVKHYNKRNIVTMELPLSLVNQMKEILDDEDRIKAKKASMRQLIGPILKDYTV